jgi:hypothetical protein
VDDDDRKQIALFSILYGFYGLLVAGTISVSKLDQHFAHPLRPTSQSAAPKTCSATPQLKG